MTLDRICNEPIVAGYSLGVYANFEVVIQLADYYVNVSKLCQDQRKKFKTWLQFYTSYDLIFACARDNLSNTGTLVNPLKIIEHENANVRGIYLHPNLLPSVVSWLSADFAIMMNHMINGNMNVEPRAVADIRIVHYHEAPKPQETPMTEEAEDLVPVLETLDIPPQTTLSNLDALDDSTSVIASPATGQEASEAAGFSLPKTVENEMENDTPLAEAAVSTGDSADDDATPTMTDADDTGEERTENQNTGSTMATVLSDDNNNSSPTTADVAAKLEGGTEASASIPTEDTSERTKGLLHSETAGDPSKEPEVSLDLENINSNHSSSSSESTSETIEENAATTALPKSTSLYEMAIVAKRYPDSNFPYYVLKSEKHVLDRALAMYNKNYPNANTLLKLEYIPGKSDLYTKLKTELKLEAQGNHFYTSLSEEQLVSEIMSIYAE